MIFPDAGFPPYLETDQPLELDQLPLQVMLLTGELAMQRRTLMALAELLGQAASLLQLPSGLMGFGSDGGET